LATFPFEIFVQRKIGNGPEATRQISCGVEAGSYVLDPKMPSRVSSSRVGDLSGLNQIYRHGGDIDASDGINYMSIHGLRGETAHR